MSMKHLLAALLFCSLAASAASGAEALRASHPDLQAASAPWRTLVGETLTYDIAFLWFDRLAEGETNFREAERPGTYRAVLEARTLGVAALFTRNRVQRYEALMEMGPEGRFRSLEYDSRVLKGSGEERRDRGSRLIFDYTARQARYIKIKEGKEYKEELLELPEKGEYFDILTAFYNFRAGLFGPVERNRRYVIPTFSKKGASEIVVETLSEKAQAARSFFPKGGLLCRVKVDPEVFDTGSGGVYVWFDEFGRPAKGEVENVVGMGDVRGSLRKP